MTTLIVTLPVGAAGLQTAYEHVLSTADGRAVASHARSAAALLPTPGGGADIVALVPAAKLSWHQVSLPKNTLDRKLLGEAAAQRVRAVLEGLLEDRVLDDTAQLHFALAPQPRTDAPVWVAVCEREWLRGHVQVLEAAGRAATRIVPEFAPDAAEPCLYVLGEDAAHAQLAATGRGGVQLLPLSGVGLSLLAWEPQAPVVAEPAVAAAAEQLLQRPVVVQQSAQRWLQAAQSAWDLAQFDLLATSSTRLWKRLAGAGQNLLHAPRWRAARWALGLVLVAQLVGLNAWAWKEQANLKAKQASTRELLTKTFPQIQVVVDAPAQMAREVAALRQATGAPSGRDLESTLSAVASALPPGHAATAVEYTGGETKLRGLQLGAADTMAVVARLQQQGFAAQQDGDGLVVKPGSAP
jgi:general secretion pathway protein L